MDTSVDMDDLATEPDMGPEPVVVSSEPGIGGVTVAVEEGKTQWDRSITLAQDIVQATGVSASRVKVSRDGTMAYKLDIERCSLPLPVNDVEASKRIVGAAVSAENKIRAVIRNLQKFVDSQAGEQNSSDAA